MNIELVPENDLKPSKLPQWLIGFIGNRMALVAIILLVITMVIHVNFYDLGDWGFYLFLSFLGLFSIDILLIRFGVGYRHRHTATYANEMGGYDMKTPRKYTKLNYNWYQRFYTKFRNKRVLSTFAYENRTVYVMTAKGDEFEAPLEIIRFSYKTEKASNREKILTFILKNINTKECISFTKVPYLLENEEWEDIFNILARSNFNAPTQGSATNKSISAVLNIIEGEFADAISDIGDSANNSFSMVEGMKLYK